MLTTYATLNTNINKVVRNHLMEVDALPPTMALAELACEITDLVFVELAHAGLTKETLDSVGGASSVRAKSVRNAA